VISVLECLKEERSEGRFMKCGKMPRQTRMKNPYRIATGHDRYESDQPGMLWLAITSLPHLKKKERQKETKIKRHKQNN